MEDLEKMNIEELRMSLFDKKNDDTVLTPSSIDTIRNKVLEEERANNPELFLESQKKLDSIENPHADLPFILDKKEILEIAKKNLLETKCWLVASRKAGMSIADPVTFLNELQMCALLVEYLENDKTLDITNAEAKVR